MRRALPLPLPDPSAIANWPAAVVAIFLILGVVALQIANLLVMSGVRANAAEAASGGKGLRKEVTALAASVRTLSGDVHEHIEADATWKRDVEARLPAPVVTSDTA
jgi:hypothetical protein